MLTEITEGDRSNKVMSVIWQPSACLRHSNLRRTDECWTFI